MKQPIIWVSWALEYEAAEIGAQNILARRAQGKAVRDEPMPAYLQDEAPKGPGNGTSFQWE